MNKKTLGILILIIISLITCTYFNSDILLQYTSNAKHFLIQQTTLHPYKSSLVYIISYIIITMSAIPLAAPITIFGGVLFGGLRGFLYSIIGALIGSLGAFYMIYYFIGRFIAQKYEKKITKFQDRIGKTGAFWSIFTLHLLSVFPYFLINTLAALAQVSTAHFLVATALGASPSLFMYAMSGSQMRSIGNWHDLFSPSTIIVFIVLILSITIPYYYFKNSEL